MGAEPRCAICKAKVRKGGREVYPHGFFCGSCAYCFFCWKRGRKWLTTVRE